MALESHSHRGRVNSRRAFEDFDHGDVVAHFEDESVTELTRGQANRAELVEADSFDALDHE
jgi:hypothetical protein